MHILVTGFEPFGSDTINASSEVVSRLPKSPGPHRISTAILPVAFDTSGPALEQLVDEHEPDILLCLGEAGGRSAITPEAYGVNINDARIPDNNGHQPRGHVIDLQAPPRRPAGLDPNIVAEILVRAGFNAAVSDDAGKFVCNHIAFLAYDMRVPALFIHVPAVRQTGSRALVGDETDGTTVDSGWSFEQLTDAIMTVIASL
ncbi:pyroglutamyl-peptidase I [Glutamicibacter sp.]|uniref:pyroglutamyl-peptidase I n=1 Tax=Glutamicibacter sp. TaxID=1931995 RepID=UPI002FE2D786